MQVSLIWGPPKEDLAEKLNKALTNPPSGTYLHEVLQSVDAKGVLYYTILYGDIPTT